ncbi:hypothetical protein ACFQ3P_34930 [Paraburkholderia sabiae]|uniref:Uncharacterized protein n=1 Tax=Paraburkholderia sabiae TaxID=273251 RepID=A0ABU9QLN4_9BURK|nr:hypothetical protein [Paraburkholderia sabiae]WJZ73455.1 hypothetical protein QEN71_25475 [Paraburkholderia sabiae]
MDLSLQTICHVGSAVQQLNRDVTVDQADTREKHRQSFFECLVKLKKIADRADIACATVHASLSLHQKQAFGQGAGELVMAEDDNKQ